MVSEIISASFKITPMGKGRFLIIVPVFNVKSAWDALKIADRKLKEVGGDNIVKVRSISAEPTVGYVYTCKFEFESKLSKDKLNKILHWNVYEIGCD